MARPGLSIGEVEGTVDAQAAPVAVGGGIGGAAACEQTMESSFAVRAYCWRIDLRPGDGSRIGVATNDNTTMVRRGICLLLP
jgi:hypothetical protein